MLTLVPVKMIMACTNTKHSGKSTNLCWMKIIIGIWADGIWLICLDCRAMHLECELSGDLKTVEQSTWYVNPTWRVIDWWSTTAEHNKNEQLNMILLSIRMWFKSIWFRNSIQRYFHAERMGLSVKCIVVTFSESFRTTYMAPLALTTSEAPC